MFNPIENGTIFHVQGLDCHLPPEGYVFNIISKSLEYRGVYSRAEIPENQYWERIVPPAWYKEVMKKWDLYDQQKKEGDADFYDERLEAYKRQEWDRRLNGFWFYNNGTPLYLTGMHYMFLQWWQIDIGFPKFRITDLEYFYFLQYCIEDPNCMGALEITKRRFGKCFKINTLVRMYDGTVKAIQDIKDGEYVMGNDSLPRLVYGATSGEEEMFEIIPKKGDSFTVNKSHIIYAQCTTSKIKYIRGVGKIADGTKTNPIKFTVEEYLQFSESKKKRLQIERTGWNYDEKVINIDPYFLGIWLGDGSSRNCEITNEDNEIIEYLKEYAESNELKYHNYGKKTKNGVMLRHSLSQRNSQRVKYKDVEYDNKVSLMRTLGKHEKTPIRTFGPYKKGEIELLEYKDNWLWNEMLSLNLKNNKHIPVDYKINSRENRLKLLAGLLDSDGCLVYNNGRPNYFKISFSNKYSALIKDVKELVQSLGFSCNERQESCANATQFTIFGNIHLIPTKVKRKQAEKVDRKYNSLLCGFSVKSVGIDKYYGFAVDDNHLFLLADGTIVHNTYRGGLFLYEYITRTKRTNAGIQSKTGTDSKKLYNKAVINPFILLPKFFRPDYDMGGGMRPKTALVFQQTNVKGKKAESGLGKDELGSMIDYEDADLYAYDGQKIHRYFADEWAKTDAINIYDRHEVIRYCLMDDEGNIIGKALYSSTVEKSEKADDKSDITQAAKKLWDESDHMNRMENGRTPSGLYRFFMTADRARNFDIYGYPDVEKTIKAILADRESVKNNARALAARTRKEARIIEEAWLEDNEKCIFNSINIKDRLSQLSLNPIYKRSIIFYRDPETQESKFRDIRKGEESFCWKVTHIPPKSEQNKYIVDRNMRKPGRAKVGAISVDSYSNSQGGRKYGSNASAWIGLKYDISNPDNTKKAIGHLFGRPNEKDDLHEQVLLAAEFYGFPVWFEHNSDSYDTYFRDRGKRGYLGIYPLSCIPPEKRQTAERFRGVPTTPFSLTTQHDTGIAYFENDIYRIDFPDLLENAKKFDPHDRTKFDAVVSFLILLVVLNEPVIEPSPPATPLVKIYPNSGAATMGQPA